MPGPIIKKVRFAEGEPMEIDPQAALVASTSDKELLPSSNSDNVDMSSPAVSPSLAYSPTIFSLPALAHITGADINMDGTDSCAGPSSG
ncbi:hypothetical protein PAXRUDRAFT_20536 [Paxillus rubicundulus Ve08.2h10]|uniref:Uncharacterized protein n=1 Tax=Paxillus rubicundulus Ve08.2h10 TaxID=930991 RepID=A0A0D0BQD6_9AGAM|nr:hypothetical protein PAXRUDRAFT_20536 [Paxillus rubicundulus Ve08.2h10]